MIAGGGFDDREGLISREKRGVEVCMTGQIYTMGNLQATQEGRVIACRRRWHPGRVIVALHYATL